MKIIRAVERFVEAAIVNKIKKIEGNNIVDSDANALNSVLTEYKGNRVKLDGEMIKVLEKELGDFDINF